MIKDHEEYQPLSLWETLQVWTVILVACALWCWGVYAVIKYMVRFL